MAFPSDWDRVPIRWRAVFLDGSIPKGTLTVRASISRFFDDDTSLPITILGNEVPIPIDDQGFAYFSLPATDDPDVSPNGFTYTLTENVVGMAPFSYTFQVPIAMLSSGIELSRSVSIAPATGQLLPTYGVFQNGTGAPSSGTGQNGYMYLDTASYILYGPKANGVWPAGVSLIGPSGGGSGAVPTGGTTGQVLTRQGTTGLAWTTVSAGTTAPAGSETLAGILRLATTAETNAGAATDVAVSPARLAARIPAASVTVAGLTRLATVGETTAGTLTTVAVTPAGMAAAAVTPPQGSTTQSGLVRLATVAEATAGSSQTVAATPAGVAAEVAQGTPSASTTIAGLLRIATPSEADAGSLTSVAVTPASLAAYVSSHSSGGASVAAATESTAGVVRLATTTEVASGTATDIAVSPARLAAKVPAATVTVAGLLRIATAGEADAGGLTTVAITPASLAAYVAAHASGGSSTPASASETLAGISRYATAAEAAAGALNTVTITPAKMKTALDLKAPLSSPTFLGTVAFGSATAVTGLTKAMVGLDQASNTSDAAKAISTLTQAALDLKAPYTVTDGLNTRIGAAESTLASISQTTQILMPNDYTLPTGTTGLTNVPNMGVNVPAFSTWAVTLQLSMSGPTANLVSCHMYKPPNGALRGNWTGPVATNTAVGQAFTSLTASGNVGQTFGLLPGTNYQLYLCTAIVTVGDTGGVLTPRIAQVTAGTSGVFVQSLASWVLYTRLA